MIQPYEGHCEPESRRDAESPLESAARQLGRTAIANGGAQASQRRVLQGRQERDLEIWAKETGCWITDADLALKGFIIGGEEHRVLPGSLDFLKATYPGKYGFSVISTDSGPTLTNALPSEYLQRCLLSNRLFHDDIRLLGITQEPAGLVILTSQPTVVGQAASREEMIAFFTALHFVLIPNFSAGYRGSLTFYRDLDQMAVFDAHPANILKDRNNVLLPIDTIVVPADEALADQLLALIP
jgi:hypothetical protein